MNAGAGSAGRVPDLIEPIIGYRQWRLDDAVLWSMYVDHPWRRGVNTAVCTLPDRHPDSPPGHACTCGIHAWYRPCPRLGSAIGNLVAGVVALWGEVELHAMGMRAQYAVVVALALPLSRMGKRRRVIDIADAFEADAVPARHLTEVALRHGRALGRSLAPGAQRPTIGVARPDPAHVIRGH